MLNPIIYVILRSKKEVFYAAAKRLFLFKTTKTRIDKIPKEKTQ